MRALSRCRICRRPHHQNTNKNTNKNTKLALLYKRTLSVRSGLVKQTSGLRPDGCKVSRRL